MGNIRENGGERETGHELGLGKEGPVLPGPAGHLKECYFYPDREGKTWRVFSRQSSGPYLIAAVDWVRGQD